MNDPHEIITAPQLAAPVGYSHAVVAGEGRHVFLGGQVALAPNGTIQGDTIVEQFDIAAGNVVTALRAAGGEPHHIVSMLVFVTDMASYRESLRDLGPIWQKHFGRRYPAMALFGVTALLEDAAFVELVATAVIP